MSAQSERAEQFRALHAGPAPLLLPNAWDVVSARVFERAGFPAVATSSAGVAASLGYLDGENLPLSEMVDATARIASRLAVPLSADVVAGYGATAAAVASSVRRILRAGAVGVNLEDVHHDTGQLVPIARQVDKLRALRQLGESTGVPLVLNARTDALRHAPGDETARRRIAIERLTAYRDAGADCLYPMGAVHAEEIREIAAAVQAPINVMVRPGLPPVAELATLGVRRISFGPAASYAALGLLRRASAEVRHQGTYALLNDGALTYDELQALLRDPAHPAG